MKETITNMENNVKNKQLKRNIAFVGLSLIMIAIYILFDGLGMIITSSKAINLGQVKNTSLSETASEIALRIVTGNMLELYIHRIIILVLVALPIFFLAFKYHISFRNNNSSRIKGMIPYLRVVFGILLFYYVLTLGTHFSHEVFTNYYSFGLWLCFFRIEGAFAVFAAFIIDWPSAFASLKRLPTSHPNLFKALFVLFISICSCMLVEFQAASKMSMLSNMLIFNIMYWIILQVLIGLITRNVKIGAFISIGLSYLIGIVNDVVFQFRGNYVIFGDLTVVRTALEVAGNYKYAPDKWFWIALVLLVFLVTVTILIKFPKNKKTDIKEIAVRAGIFVAVSVCVFFAYKNGVLYNKIFGVGWDYNKNVAHSGYVAYFLSNMNSLQKVTLDGYEASLADAAFDNAGEADTQKKVSAPNIIIIQNEAFSDLSVLYDIKTNKDYMPFIHSMTENTRKGYLNMSITGGPTANSEFEVLMRSTMNFFPYGSVPYTQYVNAELPSVAQVLKSQPVPYHTVSYHSYYASGYRRRSVYDHFGFDESFFEDNYLEDYSETDIIRRYLSDSANYRRVEKIYEDYRKKSNEPWFCFNVTMQNHGGYTELYDPVGEDKVYITNFDAPYTINGYLSLVKKSDDAFRELVEYFKNCKEPTIIAMYGDHQPAFDQQTLEILGKHTVGNNLNNYYVPYVIWANFDIEESDTLGNMEQGRVLNTLSTNYFASTVFEIAGIKLSDYDRYLLDLHERVPAITALGVWDSKGNYYSTAETAPSADDLRKYRMIQYNLVFDDKNRLTKRFVSN